MKSDLHINNIRETSIERSIWNEDEKTEWIYHHIITILGTNNSYAETNDQCISDEELTFENEFRRLWIEHVLWTSNYITSATTAGAEDQEQVLARLLKNQEDIGDAINKNQA